jgi:hypothetical protein
MLRAVALGEGFYSDADLDTAISAFRALAGVRAFAGA